jgi:hypothetical protein
MNQQRIPSEKKMSSLAPTVRPCELRLERPGHAPDGSERVEFVCGASGGPEDGYVLGIAGEDLAPMAAICNACPIPNALASSRSCLNLVPVRRFSGGRRSRPVLQTNHQAKDYEEQPDTRFACRWFYTLYGEAQPHDTRMCQDCPHWFPRPPLKLIPEYWEETCKMLRIVAGEQKILRPPTGFRPTSESSRPLTWWQRLSTMLHLLIPPTSGGRRRIDL